MSKTHDCFPVHCATPARSSYHRFLLLFSRLSYHEVFEPSYILRINSKWFSSNLQLLNHMLVRRILYAAYRSPPLACSHLVENCAVGRFPFRCIYCFRCLTTKFLALLSVARYLVPQHKSVHKYNDTNSKAASQPLARTYGQSISGISCDFFYRADATAR